MAHFENHCTRPFFVDDPILCPPTVSCWLHNLVSFLPGPNCFDHLMQFDIVSIGFLFLNTRFYCCPHVKNWLDLHLWAANVIKPVWSGASSEITPLNAKVRLHYHCLFHNWFRFFVYTSMTFELSITPSVHTPVMTPCTLSAVEKVHKVFSC